MKTTLALALVGTIAVSDALVVQHKLAQTNTAPASWGKEDYESFLWGCFATGDKTAAGAGNYHLAWNTAVNTCLWGTFNTGNGSAQSVPAAWGKQDYIDFVTSCYAKGDAAGPLASNYHTGWDNAVNTCLGGMFAPAALNKGPPTSWGKGDYQNQFNTCFGQGDSAAASASNYHTAWDSTVNKCLGAVFCPTFGSVQAPAAWGKGDYQNWEVACFAQGDSAAAGSANYHNTWDSTVNQCLASKC